MQDRKSVKYKKKNFQFIAQSSLTISRRDDFSDSSSSAVPLGSLSRARARACQCDDGVGDDGISGSNGGGDGSALL